MFLTPPTMMTFLISVAIAVLAIALPYLPVHIPVDRFVILAAGYIVLFLGNLIRGI
jgi:hypothetical protein